MRGGERGEGERKMRSDFVSLLGADFKRKAVIRSSVHMFYCFNTWREREREKREETCRQLLTVNE